MIDPFIALDGLTDEELMQDAFVPPPVVAEKADEPVAFDTIYVPPLPAGVAVDQRLASETGGWIEDYVRYASSKSPMTPRPFHVSAGLMLPSVAVARRLVVNLSFGSFYPNLWVLWLASTTIWAKTTALGVFRSVARDAIPHLLLPDEATPEALLADMAGQQPHNLDDMTASARSTWEKGRNFAAQRGLVLDEASGLLAGAGKDYAAGLLESYLKFFDGTGHTRSTRNSGWTVVRDPYLSLLAASTPSAMASYLQSDRLWSMGWWPRCALLTPETDRPAWQVARNVEQPANLVEGLAKLNAMLPQASWPDPPQAQSVVLGSGVHAAIERYAKAVRYDLLDEALDRRLHGTYGRLPAQLIKVATLVAAMDLASGVVRMPNVTIELPHVAWAMNVVEDWRASAHRVLVRVDESEHDRLRRQVVAVVERHLPDGASMRDLKKALPRISEAQVSLALGELTAEQVLKEVPAKPGPKGGRPTVRYTR